MGISILLMRGSDKKCLPNNRNGPYVSVTVVDKNELGREGRCDGSRRKLLRPKPIEHALPSTYHANVLIIYSNKAAIGTFSSEITTSTSLRNLRFWDATVTSTAPDNDDDGYTPAFWSELRKKGSSYMAGPDKKVSNKNIPYKTNT